MNLIEAAKQALEALRLSWSGAYVDGDKARKLSETAINQLRAAIEEAEAIPKIPKNELPERIYLQISDDPDDEWYGEIVWREVTWSHDKIHSNDLVFIRQDLIPAAPAVAEEPDQTKIEMVMGAISKHLTTATYPRELAAAAQYIVHRYCTHPAPAVPEGWQLVPKEPTFEMIHAGTPSTEGHYSLPVSLYKSMLASAPKFGEKE